MELLPRPAILHATRQGMEELCMHCATSKHRCILG